MVIGYIIHSMIFKKLKYNIHLLLMQNNTMNTIDVYKYFTTKMELLKHKQYQYDKLYNKYGEIAEQLETKLINLNEGDERKVIILQLSITHHIRIELFEIRQKIELEIEIRKKAKELYENDVDNNENDYNENDDIDNNDNENDELINYDLELATIN